MSGAEESARRILREMENGRQPARRRTKEINMDQTTTTGDADIFPPDRPKPELRAVPTAKIISGEKIGLVSESEPPANLIVSITDFLAGFVAPVICLMASCSVSSSTR